MFKVEKYHETNRTIMHYSTLYKISFWNIKISLIIRNAYKKYIFVWIDTGLEAKELHSI